jgi:hypothetical protein
MGKDEARGTIIAVLRVLSRAYESARAFACAVHKASYPDKDPVELAFEDHCSRFDRYLAWLSAAGHRERGLLILDESSRETSLQRMAKDFMSLGTTWGVIRNLADIPFFVNSRASRVVQLADHVACAVFRRYEAGDTQYLDVVASRFDSAEGVLHRLAHKQTYDLQCMCPACMSRRMSGVSREPV